MHGAAAYRHAVYAVIVDTLTGDFHAVHVTVANYRNLGRGRDLADPVPVGKAVVPLQAGTAMHREHLHAFALGNPEGLHHVDAFGIPADAALEREGHIDPAGIESRAHLVQNLLQARQVPKQARAAPLARHLRRRTSRVHLDKIGLQRHRDLLRRGRHLVGKAPENLHPEGPLFRKEPELPVSVQIKNRIAVRRHELRYQEPHPVPGKHAAQPAERRIRHPVHRGQYRIREHFQTPQPERYPGGLFGFF